MATTESELTQRLEETLNVTHQERADWLRTLQLEYVKRSLNATMGDLLLHFNQDTALRNNILLFFSLNVTDQLKYSLCLGDITGENTHEEQITHILDSLGFDPSSIAHLPPGPEYPYQRNWELAEGIVSSLRDTSTKFNEYAGAISLHYPSELGTGSITFYRTKRGDEENLWFQWHPHSETNAIHHSTVPPTSPEEMRKAQELIQKLYYQN